MDKLEGQNQDRNRGRLTTNANYLEDLKNLLEARKHERIVLDAMVKTLEEQIKNARMEQSELQAAEKAVEGCLVQAESVAKNLEGLQGVQPDWDASSLVKKSTDKLDSVVSYLKGQLSTTQIKLEVFTARIEFSQHHLEDLQEKNRRKTTEIDAVAASYNAALAANGG